MQSFSYKVKSELCRTAVSRLCCARAEAYGVLLYCNTFTPTLVRIITENAEFAARLPRLFQRAFSVKFDRLPEDDGGHGKLVFQITHPEKLDRIINQLGYDPRQTMVLHVNFALLEDECCRTAFLRGAFLAAPVVALGGIAMCAALLPVPGVTDGLPKMGDLLVIFYLFPIPAMAIMLAGSSSGSPYGGIGFSREMIMMLAYEVPLLMIMLTVAMKVGGGSGAEFSLTKIMDYQAEHGSFGLTPVMWPAFLAWLMFLPATLGVPPFDQPEAETEILEGPLLEYSGVLLAFFHMASALKMVVALALGVVLFFPGTISDIPAVNLVWFVVKCALFMLFTLTVVKSATGRLRIEQALSFFLKYPAGLALLSLILVWIGC